MYVDIYHIYVGLSIPASSRSYFEQSDQDSRLRNSIPDARLHSTPVHQHQLLQQLLPETHLGLLVGLQGGRLRGVGEDEVDEDGGEEEQAAHHRKGEGEASNLIESSSDNRSHNLP